MNHDVRHRLEDLLGRQIAAAQSLAQTLAAERTALTGDSPEAVKEKAAEKVGLLNSMEELEGERRTLWGTSGAAQKGDLDGTVGEKFRHGHVAVDPLRGLDHDGFVSSAT